MSNKLLFRLAVLVAAMMCALGAAAVEFEAYAYYTPSNTTLTFYYDDQRYDRHFASRYSYDLNTGKNIPGWHTDGVYENVTWVVFDPAFTLARPTTTYMWFDGMEKLEYIDCLRYLNTSEVTDMAWMFSECRYLDWIDLSSFDTRNVTNMSCMFDGCGYLESLDLSSFDTRNVTDMGYMFDGCGYLESLDLSSFDTRNVTNMSCMFDGCGYLESLDLSSFDTRNVTDMSNMFNSCLELRTIYVGDGWTTAAVTSSSYMFDVCTSLVGGQGTAYNDANPKDKTYAHIDGGPSNPGYFHEAKAYACYTPENTTLTFYYDRQREIRPGTTYDLNTGSAIPGWEANGTNANVTQVTFDPSFASARPTSTYDWFGEMQGVVSITGLNYLNTSEVTNMAYMFYGCTGLRSLDLSGFNTSKVTDMSSMFNHCNSLTSLDLSSFNTARVTNMSMMFQTCINLKTIYVGSGWSTATVTSSQNMFQNCNRIVGGQGTTYSSSHVDKTYAHIDGGPSNPGYFTDIQIAMQPYVALSGDGTTLTFYKDGKIATHTEPTFMLNEPDQTPGWSIYRNVTTVVFDPSFAPVHPTYMGDWFDGLRYLTSIQGLENLNTSQVTSMKSLFDGCTSLVNVDLRYFDTGNVTNMNSMFQDCSSMSQLDLSSFDTRKVTEMNSMFRGCTSLESLDLSSFDTHSVTRMIWMFYNCSNLTTIYAGSNWDTAGVTSSSSMFANCTSLVGGQGTAYNDANPKDKTYAHIDGGTSNPGYFTRDPNSPEPYACYTPSNTTLTFYYDTQRNTRPGITFSIYEGMVDPEWYEDGYSYDITKVVFDPSFASARPTSTQLWFAEMQDLTSIEGMQYLNTSKVTTMSGMFWECTNLPAVDVSGFDTHKVTDMSWLFSECYELNGLDASGWNTSNVTTMQGLFGNCSSLTSIDVSHFNTSNVTNMSQLFDGCSGLTSLDVSNFDTSNVTDMSYMFNWCKGLQQLDLSGFNTSKVTDMSCMFNESSNLRTIYVGDGWTTAAVTSSSYMFDVCTSLVGGKGTTYNANHVDKTYAHIDGGTSNPGYFSEKGGAFLRGDVNGDGNVSITDVTVLINYLLSHNATGVNLDAADCNQDNSVTISDVTALIAYLLSGNWN